MAILEDMEASLVIRLNLPLTDLRQGINTLHVALIDGDNLRLEQTIAFLASAPAAIPVNKNSVRSIGSLELRFCNLPDAMKDLKALNCPRGSNSDTKSKSVPKLDGSPYWVQSSSERKKRQGEAKKQTLARLKKTRDCSSRVKDSNKNSKLRPVPKIRNNSCQLKPLPKRNRVR